MSKKRSFALFGVFVLWISSLYSFEKPVFIIQPNGWEYGIEFQIEEYARSYEANLSDWIIPFENGVRIDKKIAAFDDRKFIINNRYTLTLSEELTINELVDCYEVLCNEKLLLFILSNDEGSNTKVQNSSVIFTFEDEEVIFAPGRISIENKDNFNLRTIYLNIRIYEAIFSKIKLFNSNRFEYKIGEIIGTADRISITFFHPVLPTDLVPIFVCVHEIEH